MCTAKKVRSWGLLALASTLLFLSSGSAWSQSGLVEERVTEENGFYESCGEGAGLSPCRDINGETYDEEVRGPSIDTESTEELAEGAARIRSETPAELDQTITDLEQGMNPDNLATEGLRH